MDYLQFFVGKLLLVLVVGRVAVEKQAESLVSLYLDCPWTGILLHLLQAEIKAAYLLSKWLWNKLKHQEQWDSSDYSRCSPPSSLTIWLQPQYPHGGRQEQTATLPSDPTYPPWHMCSHSHTYTSTHSQFCLILYGGGGLLERQLKGTCCCSPKKPEFSY